MRRITLPLAAFAFLVAALVLACVVAPTPTHAAITPDDPGNFITTWNTENSGTSANNQITIPGTGAGYNYEIYWENTASSTQNGTTSTIVTSSHTLTFPEPGIYEVQISGAFPRIYFNNGGDRQKILTVEQWGNIAWTSFYYAFYGCANLTVPATDAPDLSGVTSLQGMFMNAYSLEPFDVSGWDVSGITTMRSLFEATKVMSGIDLSSWDVSNVQDMDRLLNNPKASFSSDIGIVNWDVSSVTKMHRIFSNYSVSFDIDGVVDFNQDITGWDVSSVQIMQSVFWNTRFNRDIGHWNVSNVTNMSGMFSGAVDFNQDIGNWDVSKVTTFYNTQSGGIFQNALAFDQSLASWNLASTTDMTNFFRGASLSQANLDATLAGWAGQTLQPNVPLNIGARTYTAIGAAAINTLRTTYNWTVTEQLVFSYDAGPNATLSGTSRQQVNVGSSSSAVEVIPNDRYRFVRWSDGRTDNPRTDTAVTDHLTVSAVVEWDGGGSCSNCGNRSAAIKSEEPATDQETGTTTPKGAEIKTAPETVATTGTPKTDGLQEETNDSSLTALITLLVSLGIIPEEKASTARALAHEHSATGTRATTPFRFTTPLKEGDTHPEVKLLQQFLNAHGFTVAQTGAGSKGQETDHYGLRTKEAVSRFQEAYRVNILTPLGLTVGTGYFGPATIVKVNAILAGTR